jgi:hypothetical protein
MRVLSIYYKYVVLTTSTLTFQVPAHVMCTNSAKGNQCVVFQPSCVSAVVSSRLGAISALALTFCTSVFTPTGAQVVACPRAPAAAAASARTVVDP